LLLSREGGGGERGGKLIFQKGGGEKKGRGKKGMMSSPCLSAHAIANRGKEGKKGEI